MLAYRNLTLRNVIFYREEEGRDLMSKRNADFKLAFFQPQLLASSMYDFDGEIEYLMPGMKQPRSRKSKKELLQGGRQRGVIEGEPINGGLLGHALKPEVMYNYPSLDYMAHPMYTPEFDNRLIRPAEDHRFSCYPNGYYGDHRQYASTLPYSAANAPIPAPKYGYDLQRHCYADVGYAGLDVCKAATYPDNNSFDMRLKTEAVNYPVETHLGKDVELRHHGTIFQNSASILSAEPVLCNVASQYSSSYDLLRSGSDQYSSLSMKVMNDKHKSKSCRLSNNANAQKRPYSQEGMLSNSGKKTQLDVPQLSWPTQINSGPKLTNIWSAVSLSNGYASHSVPSSPKHWPLQTEHDVSSKYRSALKTSLAVQHRTSAIAATHVNGTCGKASVIKAAWPPVSSDCRTRESCIISTGSVIRCANDEEVSPVCYYLVFFAGRTCKI